MTATNGKSFLQIIIYIKSYYIINKYYFMCICTLYTYLVSDVLRNNKFGGQNKPLKGQYWHMILYRALTAGNLCAAAAKSLQSCPTLCNPIDSSPPGFLVPEILQARTLEWVAISFSNAWKWKVKVKTLSRVRLCATPWTATYQAPPSMGFSRQEYWSGVPLPSTLFKYYPIEFTGIFQCLIFSDRL